MKQKLGLVVAAIGAAALVFLVMNSDRPALMPNSPSAPKPAAPAPETLIGEAPPPVESAGEPAAVGAGTIEVLVRRKDESPIAGASVASGKVRAKSDASGKATLEGVPAGSAVVVRAEGPDPTDIAAQQKVRVANGATATVTLVLGRGGAVTGTVYDESGAPIGAAYSVSLRRLPDGLSENALGMFAAGWRGGAATQTDFPAGTTTFEVRGVRPGKYVATGRAPGRVDANSKMFTVSAGAFTRGVEIHLAHGGRVSGVVVRASGGEPVKGATVSLGKSQLATVFPGRGFSFPGSHSGKTDDQGRFVLDGVEPGTYTLRASAQHLASGVVPEVVVEKDRETNDLYVSLGEGGAITGTVYDEAGQPVGGASLRIQPVRKNVRMFGDFGLRVTADEKGVYLVEHLDPGRYRVIRAGAGNAGMSMTIVMSGSKPTKDDDPGDDGTSILVQEGQVARFDVRSATTAGVRGVVTDPDGKPLSEMIQLVEVDVDRPEAEKGSPVLRFPHMARSDKEGKFEFRDLAPGTYRLEVAGVEKQVTISAGRFETVTLRVVHSKVEGVVLDESGRPVEGARVYLRSTGRSSGGISFLGFGGGNSGKTDKQGRFAIERANPGHYRVLATKNNLRTRGEEIEVVPGQSLQNVRVVLVEATEVRIRVRDDEGAPVAGASFFFRSADDTGAQGGRTDKQGEGVVRLLPGDYTLNVSRPGGKSVEQEILVGRGNRQDVEVPLR